jgi:hypothetical protein
MAYVDVSMLDFSGMATLTEGGGLLTIADEIIFAMYR